MGRVDARLEDDISLNRSVERAYLDVHLTLASDPTWSPRRRFWLRELWIIRYSDV